MFQDHITPAEAEQLFNNIREDNWRELTNIEYTQLLRFQMSFIRSRSLQEKSDYYAFYLSVAIEQTENNPRAQGLWLGLEKNLLAVCKDLAKTIQELNDINSTATNTTRFSLSTAPAA